MRRPHIAGRFSAAPVWIALVTALLVASCTGSTTASSSSPTGSPGTGGQQADPPPVFAMYYLWWDRGHWLSHLGPGYPTQRGAQPLPAHLDASGCNAVTRYPGNVETDISPGLQYDQANPATIARDVKLAAAAGLTGFVVNWIGAGTPAQDPSSTALNQRLQYTFNAVHRINARGGHFSIILNYQSSARHLTTTQFRNDFKYFLSRYGRDSALDHRFSRRPEVVMAGTWKYSDRDLAVISHTFRSRFYLMGDEKPASWDNRRAALLDGTSYYWSSQNPIKNRSSFATLHRFAATVRKAKNPDGRPKTWLAPFIPGYNASLLYHTSTCVPRDNGQTMRSLFAGNSASHPDGWTLISWNEITEGTYVVPLLRYGKTYLNVLKSIIVRR